MANRPPQDALLRNLMPRPDRPEPPLYHYGFPFTTRFAINYARRHYLKVEIDEEDRDIFGGRAILDMADLDDEWLESDEDVNSFAMSVSRMLMVRDLSRRCGHVLDIGRPFTNEREWIISLWSNHNFDKRFEECFVPAKTLEVLKVAMREDEGQASDRPQWWFDWDNDVGVFTSIA